MSSSSSLPASVNRPNPDRIAQGFQALADGKRLRILERLVDGELCVCELMEFMGISQSLLSFHLKTLRDAGLVRDRKEGRWVHYSLNHAALEELGAWASGLGGSPEAGSVSRGDTCCASPGSSGR